jgi:uncharacterized membrane protein YkoI
MATSTKTVAWSAVTAALVGAGTAIVVMTITDDDSSVVSPREIAGVSIITPTTQVESLLMPSDSVPDTLTVLPEGARAVPVPTLDAGRGVVPGLQETTGTVSYERDEFRLDGRELDMGPDRWLTSTEATGDLDGNGIVETWWMELSGTVGRSVTVFGDVDDDDIDVYEINGLSVRPLYTEVAPWSDGWNAVDVPASIDEILSTGISADDAIRLALQQVPGVATDVEIDINDGRPYWEVDVRSLDGDLYDVEIDAVTGRVIEIDRP